MGFPLSSAPPAQLYLLLSTLANHRHLNWDLHHICLLCLRHSTIFTYTICLYLMPVP